MLIKKGSLKEKEIYKLNIQYGLIPNLPIYKKVNFFGRNNESI